MSDSKPGKIVDQTLDAQTANGMLMKKIVTCRRIEILITHETFPVSGMYHSVLLPERDWSNQIPM